MSSFVRRSTRKLMSQPDFLWRWVSSVPVLKTLINRVFINVISYSTPPRPHPFSLWGPGPSGTPPANYTSWTGLTNRIFTGRHLPPVDPGAVRALPPMSAFGDLFLRRKFVACPRSTALFTFFAQWFTDSFLRTDPNDSRKNTSNHEIDLCQIYGLNTGDTTLLRATHKGRLKTQTIQSQDYPPSLFEDDGIYVRQEFLSLSYIDPDTRDYRNNVIPPPFNTPERRRQFFASGLELGNSSVFYATISTIFLREHNRLCEEIHLQHPNWDDDRLFETARNANIVQLLKVIIQDYINHLSSTAFKIFIEIGFADRQEWCRTNRIAAEFDLLYRWHALVPDVCVVDGREIANEIFRYNNAFLTERGVESFLASASEQRAGRIQLQNTPVFLVDAELAAIQKSRDWAIAPFNSYRERFGLPRYRSFDDLTGDKALADRLRQIYDDVGDVELLIGLLAEKRGRESIFGELMSFMVGSDAFSQALTSPLLANEVYSEGTFSAAGMKSIESTQSLDDIAQRNSRMNGRRAHFGLNPIPGSYGLPFFGTLIDTIDFFFISGWRRFFTKRRDRYSSSVFKVSLFQPTIVLLDQSSIEPLFAATDLRQDHGFSWAVPAPELVGNITPSIFESGVNHEVPKKLYMQMLRARSSALIETFVRVSSPFSERWLAVGTFSFREELENFAATLLFEWYFGIRPDAKNVRALYLEIFSHPFWKVTRYLPFSAYRKSLNTFLQLLQAVKGAPYFAEIRDMASSLGMNDDDATAKQLLFVTGMNSFLGLQNLAKSVVGELSQRPSLRDAISLEIRQVLGAEWPINLSDLSAASMPLLDKAIREVARLHPPVTLIFGRATRDRDIRDRDGNTFAVAAGELLMGVLPIAMQDARIFNDPSAFDPSRFDHANDNDGLIWPRGRQDSIATSADRMCPGKDVSVLVIKLLCVWLLPRYEWQLAKPAVWSDRSFSLNVAAPSGNMKVNHFRAR